MSIAESIPDGATVLIDTNPLIYWFEGSELALPFESVFADVQAGRIDAMVDPIVNHWDISAMSLIVAEAGGRFTDLAGKPGLSSQGLSSNGKIHQALVEALRK